MNYFSLYKFYLLTYLFVFIISILNIEDPILILSSYILFSLYYFKIINLDSLILYTMILWFLYEYKYIDRIINKINQIYIDILLSINSYSKELLVYHLKNDNKLNKIKFI